jgi:ABC-2 type transport system ATP-binding protein
VLHCLYAVVEGCLRVTWQYGHGFLDQDWAVIDLVIDDVNGRTGDLDAVGECVAYGVRSGKGGQKRRVEIDQTSGEGIDDRRSKNPHKPRRHNEIGFKESNPVAKRIVPLGPRFEGVEIAQNGLYSAPGGEAQSCALPVGGDGDDPAGDFATLARVGQFHHVRSGAGHENHDLPYHCPQPRGVRVSGFAFLARRSGPPGGVTGKNMLELIDLTRRYGRVVALDGLSFAVEQGQMLGFVGPNGAGKTTAMRIVLGLLEPDDGTVHWKGKPVTEDVRRRFGYMPEERGLYPKMKVRDHLIYLAELSDVGDAGTRADRWIRELGLEDRATARVETLSLGNQQRVQLAAALIHEPEVLVLDEPFAGLDPVGVDVLSGVLRKQVDAGVPVMFSSHQLELVERLCDAVAIINRGRLVAAGRVGELRTKHSRRLVFVRVDGTDGAWATRVDGAKIVERNGSAVTLHLDEDADEQDVLDAARRAGRVRHFEMVRPRLSELFREVVEQK